MPKTRDRRKKLIAALTRVQQTIEQLVLFRDGVQCCSGLVDLVVCVGRDGGGGHRLTIAGERFVGLVPEHIAKLSNRGAEPSHDGQ